MPSGVRARYCCCCCCGVCRPFADMRRGGDAPGAVSSTQCALPAGSSDGVLARRSRDSERRPRGVWPRTTGGLEVPGLGNREKVPGAGEVDMLSSLGYVIVASVCLSLALAVLRRTEAFGVC